MVPVDVLLDDESSLDAGVLVAVVVDVADGNDAVPVT